MKYYAKRENNMNSHSLFSTLFYKGFHKTLHTAKVRDGNHEARLWNEVNERAEGMPS
jgi:hypothetical protein